MILRKQSNWPKAWIVKILNAKALNVHSSPTSSDEWSEYYDPLSHASIVAGQR